MKYGLEQPIIDALIGCLAANPKIEEAILYGSRAKGNFKQGSDIDMTLKGDALTLTDVFTLENQIEDLLLPYKFDISILKQIENIDLLEHIQRVGIAFYKKNKVDTEGGASEWKVCKLGEVATIVDCEHKTAPTVEQSDYISVRTSNISNGKIDYKNSNRVSLETYEEWTKRMKPQEGDLIFAREAPVGEVGLVQKNWKVCLGQRTVLIRPNDEFIDYRYLLYYLINPDVKFDLISRSTGSVVAHINVKDIKNFDLNIFKSIEKQKAIAQVLSSLDDKIDLLHRQNATLEALAETLFRQWFVEEAREDWEDTKLEKHTEVFRGLSYKGSGLAEKGNGLPMHNLNSVYEGGGYKHEGIKFYMGDYKERHLIEAGDIIVTNTEQGHELRLIGFPAIVPNTYGEKGLFSQHIYKLSLLNNTYISKEFIYYLLMTPSVREQITAATNGSTVNMLSIDGLQRPEFKLPPREKVIEFTIIVSNYWKKKNINQTQIRTLTALRDTLLPKLMSGEVRVKM